MSVAIIDLEHPLDPSTDSISGLLPEQEWCEDCRFDDDPYDDMTGLDVPGMPRDVVERTVEVDTSWGPDGPLYDVTYLACGHTLARRC